MATRGGANDLTDQPSSGRMMGGSATQVIDAVHFCKKPLHLVLRCNDSKYSLHNYSKLSHHAIRHTHPVLSQCLPCGQLLLTVDISIVLRHFLLLCIGVRILLVVFSSVKRFQKLLLDLVVTPGATTVIGNIETDQLLQTIGTEPSHVIEPDEERKHNKEYPSDNEENSNDLTAQQARVEGTPSKFIKPTCVLALSVRSQNAVGCSKETDREDSPRPTDQMHGNGIDGIV
mmetsp:Transcript_25417/g.42247  ORF Transcript_25417/g.42247 Transcript_25417/m.42247 type:complete len:230 (-) Transcript_25417:1279-1968(-)